MRTEINNRSTVIYIDYIPRHVLLPRASSADKLWPTAIISVYTLITCFDIISECDNNLN